MPPPDTSRSWRRSAGALLLLVVIVGAALYAFRQSAPSSAPTTTVSASPSAPDLAPSPSTRPDIPFAMISVDPHRVAGPPPVVDPHCGEGARYLHDKPTSAKVPGVEGCVVIGADGGELRNGEWTLTYENGFKRTGRYVDGLPEGTWTVWYPNGWAAKSQELLHGQSNGLEVEWSEQGQRLVEREYKEGALDGRVTIYQADGTVIREVWRNGIRVEPPMIPAMPTGTP